MLELLELQARARAIRSQLALEPVTKIELDDSDVESEEQSNAKEKNQNAATSSAVPTQKNTSQKEKSPSKHAEKQQSKVVAPRPVRLKRNFRQRQTEGYESDETHETQQPSEKEKTNVDAEEIAEEPIGKEPSPEKSSPPVKETEPAAVANDDDVVPIIAEPEVLCISSSDSESDDKSTSSKVKKYINMPVVEKADRPPTEDELFLLKIKEKSEAKLKSDSVINKDGKTTERTKDTNDSQSVEKDNNHQQTDAENAMHEEEMEDGEIVEEDEIFEIAESPERPPDEEVEKTQETVTPVEKTATEKDAEQSDEIDKKQDNDDDDDGSSSSSSESDDEKKSSDGESSDGDSDSSEKKSKSLTKSTVDDDDADIIDLGKDEDLDFEQLDEMSAACEEPKKVKSPRRTRSKTKSRKSEDREKSAEPKVNIFSRNRFDG